jgi:4'-phosphopantetheinyl transferase
MDAPQHPVAHELAGNWLDRDELDRWQRFRSWNRRNQFLCGRMLVKCYIGGRLNGIRARSSDLPRLAVATDGRPYAADANPGASLSFSVSHSGTCVGAAFSTNARVGLDVEQVRPRSDALIRRICGAPAGLCQDEEAQSARLHDFYGIWTRKEARFKCGLGAAGGWRTSDATATATDACGETGLLCRTWQPLAGYIASAAVHTDDVAIHTHDVASCGLAITQTWWSFDDLLAASGGNQGA